tara:strand:- start:91873 stop:93594 length:1722 start_codon:yes stop_codon:yes gene_type:complete
MRDTTLSIAITGAGGAGVISCGELLLQAWARAGGRGLLRKAFGPQIRGGESAALLKLTADETYTPASCYDVLLALDWNNFARFEDEIRLHPDSWVICDADSELPPGLQIDPARCCKVPFARLASDCHPEGRINMLGLGILGRVLGLEREVLEQLAARKLSSKPPAYLQAASACIAGGLATTVDLSVTLPQCGTANTWLISGNQAAGLGALQAGVRFVAAYPITPASDVLEYLAGALEPLGGSLVQAEDELAAINMTIGAAFGGVPAFTATSGPGLALMTESIGLAVASETPVAILDVMRGGPSTGIPTKSEQSDLNIALHGLHGDAPHLVLAPLNIADCVFTTGWAVQLAQAAQTAAIVLSDQFLGQSTAIVEEPRQVATVPAPVTDAGSSADYLRYRLTASGISALAAPGDADHRFTADGLEHNERGTPSARHSDHQQQLAKRRDKLAALDVSDDWARVQGRGDVALLCFGSAFAAVGEAAELLGEAGIECRTVALRLLAPLCHSALLDAISGCNTLVVIEQNHGAQLYHYLLGEIRFEQAVHSYAEPGPVPLGAAAIAAAVQDITNSEAVA